LIANGAETEIVKLLLVQFGALLNLKVIFLCPGLTGIIDGSNVMSQFYTIRNYTIIIYKQPNCTYLLLHSTGAQFNSKWWALFVI